MPRGSSLRYCSALRIGVGTQVSVEVSQIFRCSQCGRNGPLGTHHVPHRPQGPHAVPKGSTCAHPMDHHLHPELRGGPNRRPNRWRAWLADAVGSMRPGAAPSRRGRGHWAGMSASGVLIGIAIRLRYQTGIELSGDRGCWATSSVSAVLVGSRSARRQRGSPRSTWSWTPSQCTYRTSLGCPSALPDRLSFLLASAGLAFCGWLAFEKRSTAERGPLMPLGLQTRGLALGTASRRLGAEG